MEAVRLFCFVEPFGSGTDPMPANANATFQATRACERHSYLVAVSVAPLYMASEAVCSLQLQLSRTLMCVFFLFFTFFLSYLMTQICNLGGGRDRLWVNGS